MSLTLLNCAWMRRELDLVFARAYLTLAAACLTMLNCNGLVQTPRVRCCSMPETRGAKANVR